MTLAERSHTDRSVVAPTLSEALVRSIDQPGGLKGTARTTRTRQDAEPGDGEQHNLVAGGLILGTLQQERFGPVDHRAVFVEQRHDRLGAVQSLVSGDAGHFFDLFQ